MMNSFIYIITFLLGMVPPLPQINGYTHWSVTSNGMIVPITTSFFHLRQPWNLVKLFLQEDNFDFTKTVDLKLNQVSEDLKLNQDYQKKVHSVYVDSNSACDKASKLLAEFDLHQTHILTLEAKGIASHTYLNESELKSSPIVNFQEPFCEKIFNKKFSMCCFEHLEAIRNRSKYEGVPEISLYKVALPKHLTPSEYGHLVSISLAKHHQSPTHNWILYNMAAFYWRVKGSAKNSIECLRAALHTSPNKYLDVALVSLANVLHLIKSTSKDALILMKNAVLISPHFSSHHIILGNIYASLGQFNDSLYHFEMAAQLHKPDKDRTKLKDIEDRIFAARCSYELSIAISTQQISLNKQLKELDTFQKNTDRYHNAKTSIELNKVNNATQKLRQKIYEAFIDYEEKQGLRNEQCSLYDEVTNQMIDCQSIERKILMDFFHELTVKPPLSLSINQLNKSDINVPKLTRQYQIISADNQFPYPRLEFNCRSLQCFNSWQNNDLVFKSIYLSPRNKGFDILNILTTLQGLEASNEHPLPWYPPYCALYVDGHQIHPVEAVDNLTIMKEIHSLKSKPEDNSRVVDEALFLELRSLVHNSNLRLEDIGQRIVTAINRGVAPLWIVLNIAGLYWRVLGNLAQAFDCQRLSAKLSPPQYRDVPMVNLAAVLLKLNETDDALKLIKSALQTDYSEPETNFLAALLFRIDGIYTLAYYHLKIAVQQEPRFDVAESEWNFLKCQLCKKQNSNSFKNEEDNEDLLTVLNVFIKHKMCTSIRECQNIISNKCQHLPHIKITMKGQSFSHTDIESLSGVASDTIPTEKDGVSQIMYGFLWNTNVTNLYILEQDCLVMNDSVRTVGCNLRNEVNEASLKAVKFLEELKCIVQNISRNTNDHFKWDSDNAKHHKCHVDPSNKSPDESQPKSKSMSQNLHDDLVKLIPPRVILSPLAPEDCEQVAPFDFKTYTPLYVSLNTMQVNVAALLDSLTPSYSFSFSQQPYCSPKGDNIFLRNILEKHKVNFESSPHSKVPEYNLHTSFLKTFADKYTLEEIGKRLYTGLMQNATDWRLATIIVNYWRVYGDANEAFKCLEVALENSPDFHLKVILVNAANILYRINKLEAALEISYHALKCMDGPKWIVIPFLIANIFATMEQWEKATLFYESCLSIKANFDEAIYRIKSIQCQQIVLTNLEQH